jgi:uncharacterized membrane protein YeaQ/YmgE (transglycosylase-associated protein family)
MNMLDLIGWLIAGLIIGGIARLLVPGRQPMGMLMTMVLGIVGALLGGFVYWIFAGVPGEPFSAYSWPGYLLAVLGAVVVLLIGIGTSNRTTTTRY